MNLVIDFFGVREGGENIWYEGPHKPSLYTVDRGHCAPDHVPQTFIINIHIKNKLCFTDSRTKQLISLMKYFPILSKAIKIIYFKFCINFGLFKFFCFSINICIYIFFYLEIFASLTEYINFEKALSRQNEAITGIWDTLCILKWQIVRKFCFFLTFLN